MHIPNGGTFAAATSVTTPAAPPAEVSAPEAEKVAGVVPNEHCSVAPVQTRFGMDPSSYSIRSCARLAAGTLSGGLPPAVGVAVDPVDLVPVQIMLTVDHRGARARSTDTKYPM